MARPPKKIWKRQQGLKSYTMGYMAEIGALFWLWGQGYHLLGRRYRTASGEIDLIMRRHHTIVFVEVKYRLRLYDALNSITEGQKWRILKASRHWLARHSWASDYDHRYDALCFGRPFTKHWVTHVPALAMPE